MRNKLIELIVGWGGLSNDAEDIADYLIANGVTVQKWIPVTERLPEPETEVMVLAERKIYSLKEKKHTTHYIVTTGMYEDGKKYTEDSKWWWETDGFEYDEELDDYIILRDGGNTSTTMGMNSTTIQLMILLPTGCHCQNRLRRRGDYESRRTRFYRIKT